MKTTQSSRVGNDSDHEWMFHIDSLHHLSHLNYINPKNQNIRVVVNQPDEKDAGHQSAVAN